jgi:hypothetical protein
MARRREPHLYTPLISEPPPETLLQKTKGYIKKSADKMYASIFGKPKTDNVYIPLYRTQDVSYYQSHRDTTDEETFFNKQLDELMESSLTHTMNHPKIANHDLQKSLLPTRLRPLDYSLSNTVTSQQTTSSSRYYDVPLSDNHNSTINQDLEQPMDDEINKYLESTFINQNITHSIPPFAIVYRDKNVPSDTDTDTETETISDTSSA